MTLGAQRDDDGAPAGGPWAGAPAGVPGTGAPSAGEDAPSAVARSGGTPPAGSQGGGSGGEFGLTRRLRTVAGHSVMFDNEGFLWSADDWGEDVAAALAAEAGLAALDDTQWRVLRFLRAYYRDNGRAPLNRALAAGTEMPLLRLESLFPGGIKQGARRLAGLPNPKTCL